MVKCYEGCFVFKFTWDQVAQGFWTKYPNPYSQHVLSEDVINREIRGSRLFSQRLLTKTNRVPKWAERFVSTRTVSILEESIVDPVNKIITTHTKNIGYTKLMGVEEWCVYRQSTENPKWTVVERKARISSAMFGVARAIEAFGFDRFRKNSQKAMFGFQYILVNKFSPEPASERNLGLVLDKTKLKETAKKATELAKARAAPLMAACAPSNQ